MKNIRLETITFCTWGSVAASGSRSLYVAAASAIGCRAADARSPRLVISSKDPRSDLDSETKGLRVIGNSNLVLPKDRVITISKSQTLILPGKVGLRNPRFDF